MAEPAWLHDAVVAAQKYTEAVAVAVEKCADDTKGQTCYICMEAVHRRTGRSRAWMRMWRSRRRCFRDDGNRARVVSGRAGEDFVGGGRGEKNGRQGEE